MNKVKVKMSDLELQLKIHTATLTVLQASDLAGKNKRLKVQFLLMDACEDLDRASKLLREETGA